MTYLKDIQRYRKAAFEYLKSRATFFTQDLDNNLDASLRVVSKLPNRPEGSDTYNALLGIKSVLDQRLLCLKLLEERLNILNKDNVGDVDYILDKAIRSLNSLPTLPKNNNPYEGLFTLEKEVSKKYNSAVVYRTNEAGVKLMHQYEGCVLTAYKDPGSSTGVPITIGWGTTRINNKPIKLGTVITQAQADEYFLEDVKVFEDAVKKLVTVPITENMFSAIVCWTYNCGVAALTSSTFLKKINKKDFVGAAEALQFFNKGANGKILKGLVKRREEESKLFLK